MHLLYSFGIFVLGFITSFLSLHSVEQYQRIEAAPVYRKMAFLPVFIILAIGSGILYFIFSPKPDFLYPQTFLQFCYFFALFFAVFATSWLIKKVWLKNL